MLIEYSVLIRELQRKLERVICFSHLLFHHLNKKGISFSPSLYQFICLNSVTNNHKLLIFKIIDLKKCTVFYLTNEMQVW